MLYLPWPGASQEKSTFLPGNERGSDLFYSKSVPRYTRERYKSRTCAIAGPQP